MQRKPVRQPVPTQTQQVPLGPPIASNPNPESLSFNPEPPRNPETANVIERSSNVYDAPNDPRPSFTQPLNVLNSTETKMYNLRKLDDPENLKINNEVEGTKVVGKVQDGFINVIKKEEKTLKNVTRDQINHSAILVCMHGNQSDLEVYGKLRNTLDCVETPLPKVIDKDTDYKRLDYQELNELKRKYLYGLQEMPTDNEYIINQQITLSSKSQELIPTPTGLGYRGTW